MQTRPSGTLPSYESIYGGNALRILDWFSDYAACRATSTPNFSPTYLEFTATIRGAILDRINGVQNPVSGAYDIRNANTCYVSYPVGGCFLTKDIKDQWCNQPGNNRNCVSHQVFRQGANPAPVGVTIDQWYNYNSLPNNYTTPRPNPGNGLYNSTYLFNPTNSLAPQQVVYNTQLNVHYHISTGLYTAGTENRYFLMGIGMSQFTGETLQAAFIRHWNRLNRDRTPVTPETYYPSTCVTGMSHVVRVEGSLRTWTTFTFQAQSQIPGVDIWFCAAP